MRNGIRVLALFAAAAAVTSCGDAVRQSRSSVMLTVASLADGTTIVSNVSVAGANQATAVLAAFMKDPGITAPASPSLSDITISRYHVSYRRADGRNVQGTDVPYDFDGALTATVSPGKTQQVSLEIVRAVAKNESPLAQLKFNNNNSSTISTIAAVTFYGRDQAGNDVGASGSVLVDFSSF